MTRNRIIKELEEIIMKGTTIKPDAIIIKGYNKENGNIKQILISIDYHSFGGNIASFIRHSINSVAEKHNLTFHEMYLDL